MPYLILTIGLPGSGKSTWAKKEMAKNADILHIELDMLREELGIDPTFPDKALMKKALKIRDDLVLNALKKGRTVICSDTNLSTKALNRLRSIGNQAKAVIQEVSFTHVPIDLCISRDKARGLEGGRSVGAEVILSLASKIRPDDEVKEEKVLVIGDVHGDYKRLLSLLSKVEITKPYDDSPHEFVPVTHSPHASHSDKLTHSTHKLVPVTHSPWSNPQGYKVIFLGDLNDPRLDDDNLNRTEMSSLKSIKIAKELWEQGIGEVVQSNHQLNLINLWNGTRKSLTHGLNYTKEEIDKADKYEVNKLILWLSSRPYYYKFLTKGKEYICVHAYYTPGMSQYHPDSVESNDALYGPRVNGVRDEWWNKDTQPVLDEKEIVRNYTVIAGHYHTFYKDSQSLILDGDCGGTNGCLLGYLPDTDTIITIN